MTQPGQGAAWDGDGVDPWMTERLAAEAALVAAEQGVFQRYWAEFSSWLVAVKRAVLSGGRLQPPDPGRVWSQAPAWTQAAADVTNGPIKATMGLAYDAVFGPGYQFDARPAVAAHLAEVNNRMVNTPGQVFDLVAETITEGAGLGEGIPALAERVDKILTATGNNLWTNRAVVVARTETLGGLNAGRWDSMEALDELLGQEEPLQRMWLATADDRTRPTHLAAEGQRVDPGGYFRVGTADLRFPGDPRGPAKEIIQCLPADTAVRFGSVRAVTRRWFEGEMVTIRFAGGDHLAITPNHPVLRADGLWIPAGQLTEGDHCVGGGGGGHTPGQPDEQAGPTLLGQFHRAACHAQAAQRVFLAEPDFHGDAAHGDVEVVPVDGRLRFDGEPASEQEITQFGLALADLARPRPRGAEGGPVPLWLPRGDVDLGLAAGGIGGRGQTATLLRGETRHAPTVRLGPVARLLTEFAEMAHDRRSTDPQGTRYRQHAVPGQVTFKQITKVDRRDFRGHVFNLDTGVGWYTANGIAVRNCRCSTLLVRRGESVDLSNRQFTDW